MRDGHVAIQILDGGWDEGVWMQRSCMLCSTPSIDSSDATSSTLRVRNGRTSSLQFPFVKKET